MGERSEDYELGKVAGILSTTAFMEVEANKKLIDLMIEKDLENDRLRAALATSEASQRALREALETTAVEASRAFGWICVLCGTSSMRRELMPHRPGCLLAATSTDAAGAEPR